MARIKIQRLAENLREKIGQIILSELKDPRHGFITVLRVEPSSDMSFAKVFVSILGSDGQQRAGIRALQAAGGYIQKRIGKTLRTRNTPVLKFVLDDSVKQSIKISSLLKEVLPRADAPDDEGAEYDDDADQDVSSDDDTEFDEEP